MADTPLITHPHGFFIQDEEVRTNSTVSSRTWVPAAELMNYMNFYARRVMPWCNVNFLSELEEYEFVIPVDPPDYSERYLWTIWAIYRTENVAASDSALILTVTSTTDSSGAVHDTSTSHVSSGTAGHATATYLTSDKDVFYVGAAVKIQGGALNLIKGAISASWALGSWIAGFAAWEVPGKAVTPAMSPSGGLTTSPFPVVPSGTATLVTPSHYYATKEIDEDVDEVEDSLRHTWCRNRAIMLNVGWGTPYDFTGGSDGGGWASVTGGEGFYIPPYCVQEGETTYKCRVVIRSENSDASGTVQWGMVTDADPSPPASPDSIVDDDTVQWRPCSTTSVFDGSVDGLEFEVLAIGEWVDLYVHQVGCTVTIYQVIAWAQEDDPA